MKHVVQYGVFATYHLALETSFLVDEGATLPELPLKSPIIAALPDKPLSADRSISIIPFLQMPTASSPNNSLQALDMKKDDLTFNGFIVMNQTVPACSPEHKSCERLGVGSSQLTFVQINNRNGNIDCLLGMVPRSSIDPLFQQSRIPFCHCPACTRDVGSKMKFEEFQPETTRHALISDFGALPAHPVNLVYVESDNSFAHNYEIG